MLKSKFDIIVEKLQAEGKVTIMEQAASDVIVSNVEKELDAYRFENQRKVRESQDEISTIILTA